MLLLFACLVQPFKLFSQGRVSTGVQPASGGFKIGGTAINSITGLPLAQVQVSLVDTKTQAPIGQMTTSADGHFQFLNLPAGKFGLEGVKRGYIPAFYDQHETFSTAIVTGPDFRTDQLVLRVIPMAVILGHVADEVGDPVRKARVTLFRIDHRFGLSRISRIGTSTTDDQGYYDFSSLSPDSYLISVNAEPWYAVNPPSPSTNSNQSTHSSSTPLDVAYPTAYYRDTTDSDTATSIDLTGGERLQVDFTLNPVPALHLIVHVPPDQTSVAPSLTFQKHLFESAENVQPKDIHLVAPDVYELTGIPAGRYMVRVKNPGSDQLEQNEIDLTHDGQDLSNIQGELLTGLKLFVKFVNADKPPAQVFFMLFNDRHHAVALSQMSPSGEAEFQNIPAGKYNILSIAPPSPLATTRSPNLAVVQTSTPSGDLSGDNVNLVAGTTTDLIVSVVRGVVTVQGIVQKSGKPVPSIMVALVPDDADRHLDSFRRDQSDFDGSFEMRAVFPGSYTIVAVEDAWGSEWLRPEVLARYVQRGQKLVIGKLMSGSVHLPEPVEVQPK